MDPQDPYCVIPARYTSTRFPGKPLQPLLGKPMVLWVAEACAEAVGAERVIIATEDDRIRATAENAGFGVEMTSPEALTGTDRVAEVADRIGGSTVINVQGDEPMVQAADILSIATLHQQNPAVVVNGYIALSDSEDPTRTTIPKVVTDLAGRLLYISRQVIPGSKAKHPSHNTTAHMKQVCIYAFSPSQLREFAAVAHKTPLESAEDIEILRFLELGQPVQMFLTQSASLAVDTPEDVAVVEAAMLHQGFHA